MNVQPLLCQSRNNRPRSRTLHSIPLLPPAVQRAPAAWGGGSVQVLVLVLTPPLSQVTDTEQSDHSPHSPHSPSMSSTRTEKELSTLSVLRCDECHLQCWKQPDWDLSGIIIRGKRLSWWCQCHRGQRKGSECEGQFVCLLLATE